MEEALAGSGIRRRLDLVRQKTFLAILRFGIYSNGRLSGVAAVEWPENMLMA